MARKTYTSLLLTIAIALLTGFIFHGSVQASASEEETDPASCRLGVYLMSLHNMDFNNNAVTADMWLWSICPTDAFTPLETMEFPNANWAGALEDFPPELDGEAYYASRKVAGEFRVFWDVKNYPFDRHAIEIILEEAAYDISEFVYQVDESGSGINPDISIPGWEISDFEIVESEKQYNTAFGYETDDPDGGSAYSRVRILVHLNRVDTTSFYKLIAAVYIAMAITLVTYFLHLTTPAIMGPRMSMLAGALFTTVINMRVSNAAFGGYEGVTLVDKIHILSLCYILVATIVTVYSRYQVDQGAPQQKIQRLNIIAFVISAATYLAANLLLISIAANIG